MGPFRTFVASAAITGMLLVTIEPAMGHEATIDFAAEAGGQGPVVAFAELGDHIATAIVYARAVPGEAEAFAAMADWLGVERGEREAVSGGPTVVDPEGDPCTPQLHFDGFVSAAGGCSQATATGDVPEAFAAASVGGLDGIDPTAEDLQPLFDAMAQLGLIEILNGRVATAEAELLDDVTTEVEGLVEGARASCRAGLSPLNDEGSLDELLDALDAASPETIGDILSAIATLVALPEGCTDLAAAAEVHVALSELESLAHNLENLPAIDGLLSVDLLKMSAVASLDEDLFMAGAGPDSIAAVELSVPALEGHLVDLLTGALAPIVLGLEATLGVLTTELASLPTADDLAAGLLANENLDVATDDPLLTIEMEPGEAFVEGDLSSLELEAEASAALVWLGGSVFSLPGLADIDDALNEADGLVDDHLVAALQASPMSSALQISFVPEEVEDAEVLGRPGLLAVSGSASIWLLPTQGPFVTVDVRGSFARMGLVVAEDEPSPSRQTPKAPGPPTPERLPNTGGGLGLLVLVGLLALGGMTLLRWPR